MTSSAIRRSLICFLLLLLVRNLCAEMTTASVVPGDQMLVADAHEEIKKLPYVEIKDKSELTLTLKKGEQRAIVPLTVRYQDEGLKNSSTFIALRPSPECIDDGISVAFILETENNGKKESCVMVLRWTQDECSLSINNRQELLTIDTRNANGKQANVAVHVEDDPTKKRCITFNRHYDGAIMGCQYRHSNGDIMGCQEDCQETSYQPCRIKSPMNFTIERRGAAYNCEITVLFEKIYHSLYVPPVTTSRVSEPSEEPRNYEAKRIEKSHPVKVEEDKGVASWVWPLVIILVLIALAIVGLAFFYFCVIRREDKELAALGLIEVEQSNPITAIETGYESKQAKSKHDPPNVVKKPANKSKHSSVKSSGSAHTAIPNYQPPEGTGLPAGYTPPPN